jgi:hypothetical protein
MPVLGESETRRDYSAEELAGEYLVIPEIDLHARRFDRVLGIMQCG